jgi:nitronate monooxygenase
MVGTMALVPQVVDAVNIPVVASGGIMDGRGIAAAFALGATGVQMGSAFLACPESGAAAAYKTAVLAAREHQTRVTSAFSGRPARGIVNRFMDQVDGERVPVMPYPVQNALTRAMRAAAGSQGRAEFLSLWAGQGVGLARSMPARDLVQELVSETERVMTTLAAPAANFRLTGG